ncbi:AZOBR_p60025 family cell surface glycopolymer formation protein [Leptospira gomenensis]|uniref:AZOBR_p60025 family cell surface glycopolymer formation protein n=1 Tax=Leptospira gomenensis TaxID=2484974 RepID=UPI003CCC8477
MRGFESIGELIRTVSENRNLCAAAFLILYSFSSFLIWKKYGYNPSAQINFGFPFVQQNTERTPRQAVVFLGQPGDSGAGYDGQIFYYYSRMLSEFNLEWPAGFETNIRAPRIGYPLLVAPFGWFGKWGTVFGMYAVHVCLILASWILIRDLCGKEKRIYSTFYLFSPFLLGSYALLVSDAALCAFLVFTYWSYKREKWFLFSLTAGAALLIKEQALFLLFPMGIQSLLDKNTRFTFSVLGALILPLVWSLFLKIHFPEWTPTRFADFFDPLQGFIGYAKEISETAFYTFLKTADWETGTILFAKRFSRVPIFLLFLTGLYVLKTGSWKLAIGLRFSFFLVLFSVFSAGYVLYWVSYENVSRMFTVSVPFLIFWKLEDDSISDRPFWLVCAAILCLFLFKLSFVSGTLPFLLWE